MYYDNQNPFGRDSYSDLMCNDAKREFSRFHFGICAFLGASTLIALIAEILILLIFKENSEAVLGNVYYKWIANVVSMYVVGLPILYLIVRSMPKQELKKSKMPIGEFLILGVKMDTPAYIGCGLIFVGIVLSQIPAREFRKLFKKL